MYISHAYKYLSIYMNMNSSSHSYSEAAISRTFQFCLSLSTDFYFFLFYHLDCDADKALGIFIFFTMLISHFPFDLPYSGEQWKTISVGNLRNSIHLLISHNGKIRGRQHFSHWMQQLAWFLNKTPLLFYAPWGRRWSNYSGKASKI